MRHFLASAPCVPAIVHSSDAAPRLIRCRFLRQLFQSAGADIDYSINGAYEAVTEPHYSKRGRRRIDRYKERQTRALFNKQNTGIELLLQLLLQKSNILGQARHVAKKFSLFFHHRSALSFAKRTR